MASPIQPTPILEDEDAVLFWESFEKATPSVRLTPTPKLAAVRELIIGNDSFVFMKMDHKKLYDNRLAESQQAEDAPTLALYYDLKKTAI